MTPALLLVLLTLPQHAAIERVDRYPARATTERVVVRADWPESSLLRLVAARLERSIPIFERETGFALPADERLVINLFATKDAYHRVSQADGASQTEATGLTLVRTRESYVVVQPSTDPAYLKAIGGLPDGLLDLVLHEAVHQFVMRAHALPERALPGWYIEGRAEFVARQAMLETGGRGTRKPLCLSTATNKVALAVGAQSYMPLAEVFGTTFKVPRTSLFYEESESLYAFLSATNGPYRERFRRFEAWLDEQTVPAGEEPFHGPIEGIEERWRACVDPLGDFEAAWATANAERDGEWHEFWRHSQWVGDELVTASNHWTTLSLLLNNDVPGRRDFSIGTEVSFLFGRGACILLGLEKDPLAFWLVEFTRDGSLSASAFADGVWTELAAVAGGDVALAAWLPFEVEVEGGELRARVGTELEIGVELEEGDDLGAGFWGLGSRRGGVRYRGIALR